MRYSAYIVAGLRTGIVSPSFPTAQTHTPFTHFTDQQQHLTPEQDRRSEQEFQHAMEIIGRYMGPDDKLVMKRRLLAGGVIRQDCNVMMAVPTEDDQAMVGTLHDEPGLAVVDTAWNKTVHGRQWREEMEQVLLQMDERLWPRQVPATGTIHGLGGGSQVKHKYIFPIAINESRAEF